ncbi:hypothetical protein OK348_12890 [Flavobacterium sp. MXW15]|uniref:Nuclear transport factor 2 family protein n=1 Tax=Xanthomonas chitinilytica TaxID=2989819 RepID=A0ABT3JWH4_9XANT|nr:hypothetical protein [Xanthomonas sp. H13-6]MCW4455682.1 hypothetical protein [Flavobacterium sp. MXW15]MCW4472832.1 hypothetical protein [Xanthomonas sp. H13-6]
MSSLLDEVVAAVRRRDANAVLAGFTPGAKMAILAPARPGGSQRLSFAQYRSMLLGNRCDLSGSRHDVSDKAARHRVVRCGACRDRAQAAAGLERRSVRR